MYLACMAIAEAEPTVAEGTTVLEPDLHMGTRIRQERNKKHWKQEELAAQIEPPVSRALIGRWENGQSFPDVSEARQMAALFGVSFGWLCGVPTECRCSASNPQVTGGAVVCATCGGTLLTQVPAARTPELPFPTAPPPLRVAVGAVSGF